MLRIDFVTLFPEMVLDALAHSIPRRAAEKGLCEYGATNPRNFAEDRRGTVDDKPFGGGPGMLMKPEPLDAALRSLQLGIPGRGRLEGDHSEAVVFPEPTGRLYTQSDALELSRLKHVVFVCGHYEGIDERAIDKWATHRFSIGDFVLSGGEIPALLMADSIIRLLPGVLGDEESLSIDSHNDGLLSAPQYTRPEVWEDRAVPEVLRSGDHGAIARWKRARAISVTRNNRPDLFARANLAKGDLDLLQSSFSASGAEQDQRSPVQPGADDRNE